MLGRDDQGADDSFEDEAGEEESAERASTESQPTEGDHAASNPQALRVAATDLDATDTCTGTYPAAPAIAGEFRAQLSELAEWDRHPKRGFRAKGDHISHLVLTATDPDDLAPLVVLPQFNGVYPIVDGLYRYHALKTAFPGNVDVEVRCILFEGNETDAVIAVADTALGTIAASAMERAEALLNLQEVANINQKAIAERYPNLSKDKVSNMLIAARVRRNYPEFYAILTEPDQAPVSYGCEILTLAKKLSADEFTSLLERAEDLAANGETFKPTDALTACGVERVVDVAATTKPTKAISAISSEPLFGDDDAPIAAYERLADNIDRIRLPDPSQMTHEEREAAAAACIAQVRKHFLLEPPG